MSDWWLYMCQKEGRFYVGITTNIEKRLKQHGNPDLLYREDPFEKHEAAEREKQIKKWGREKKLQIAKKGAGKPR